ncbi:hypothetical protein HGQ98_29775 [Achromobacter ruhlandii]|uniref:Uncharacterized protein n=1 Tax=Achromobacter ruhlandii TaxID=72557 RepID=A0A848NRC0_9BURK|nr:hypothetical protein [Achromobacter ruhlandii]
MCGSGVRGGAWGSRRWEGRGAGLCGSAVRAVGGGGGGGGGLAEGWWAGEECGGGEGG